MPNLGPTELIIILIIVIAIFGAGKLANVGGALGKGVSDFRQAVKESREEPDEAVATAPTDSAQASDGESQGEVDGEEA